MICSLSETQIGEALLLGAFTGIASFYGGFMNWNFMMASTASINPLLLPLHPAHPGMEECRLVGPGPLAAAIVGDALAAGTFVQKGRGGDR